MKKNFLIAAAIPYVNDKPHLGHAMLFTYSDVLARYHRALGAEVFFTVGTDEHGSKIAEKAASLNLTPQALVDQISVKFQQSLPQLGISYTHFTRTTGENHSRRSQLIWQKLADYIYKDTFEGWYCQGCEAYQTATSVKATGGICPDHQKAYEFLKQEENYFFKLSAFAQELSERIASDELKIIPKAAKAEVLSFIAGGLDDIPISRPLASLDWGIAVPGDSSHVMYVWFEALMNYITVLDYPEGQEFKTHWPADIQVIGRDILRFHAVIWPAMLLGLKLPLYRQLYAHGLITVDGQKMSKTIGNVVDPLELIENYSLEAFRYFFLRHLASYDSADYSHQRFVAAYNNELVDQFGNLVHRLQALIWQKLEGRLPAQATPAFQAPDFVADYHQYMADCRFGQALNVLFAEIKVLNRHLETAQPWLLDDLEQVATILDQAVVNLRELNRLLQPFLPQLTLLVEQIFEINPIKPLAQPLLSKIEVADEQA